MFDALVRVGQKSSCRRSSLLSRQWDGSRENSRENSFNARAEHASVNLPPPKSVPLSFQLPQSPRNSGAGRTRRDQYPPLMSAPLTKRLFIAEQQGGDARTSRSDDDSDGDGDVPLSPCEYVREQIGAALFSVKVAQGVAFGLLFGASAARDTGVVVAPFLREERRVLLLSAASMVCGALQVLFAFTIPFWEIGVLGVASIVLNGLLMHEVWLRRTDHLLNAVFAPVPIVVLEYIIYVMLAEALDQDSYHIADEDNLEQSVERNFTDRLSAIAGILLVLLQVVPTHRMRSRMRSLDRVDCDHMPTSRPHSNPRPAFCPGREQVVLSFFIACAVLSMNRAYRGQEEGQQPWVLQLIAFLNEHRASAVIHNSPWWSQWMSPGHQP